MPMRAHLCARIISLLQSCSTVGGGCTYLAVVPSRASAHSQLQPPTSLACCRFCRKRWLVLRCAAAHRSGCIKRAAALILVCRLLLLPMLQADPTFGSPQKTAMPALHTHSVASGCTLTQLFFLIFLKITKEKHNMRLLLLFLTVCPNPNPNPKLFLSNPTL